MSCNYGERVMTKCVSLVWKAYALYFLIAPERQAEIFQRFYREPEVHEQEGIGIGLYLDRKMTELQNGYIEVRSEIGNGAEFCIYLPNESWNQWKKGFTHIIESTIIVL